MGTVLPEGGSVPTARPGVVSAADREGYQQWTVEHAARIRRLLDSDGPQAREQLWNLLREPQAAAVDWESFFSEQPESPDFPEIVILNHSWFVWKRMVGLDRQFAPVLLPGGAVPNSAFFTHVDVASYTPEFLRAEQEEIRPQGNITVTRAKKGGTAEGFFGKDQRGREYIFVFDPPFNPEMVSSAEFIGSTLARMAGYNVPKTTVTRIAGTGRPEYDGRRAVATVALEGFRGNWTYRANAARRELRGLRILAAWLHNVDQTSHNTANSFRAEGVALRYIFDFGASLGSFTFRAKWPGLGDYYLFAPAGHLGGVITGGEWRQPFALVSPAVGYFGARVDAERWRPFYRNFAFEEATWDDNVWGARLLGQFSDEQIRTVVELAGYSNLGDAEYVAATLIARRDQILGYYLDESTREQDDDRAVRKDDGGRKDD